MLLYRRRIKMKEEIVRKAVEDVRNMNSGDEFSVSRLVGKYDNDVDSKTLFEYANAILDALKEENIPYESLIKPDEQGRAPVVGLLYSFEYIRK